MKQSEREEVNAMSDGGQSISGHTRRKRVLTTDLSSSSISDSATKHSDKKAKPLPHIKKDGDFKDLVTKSTIYADKSLFIKDVIEDDATGLLIAMPRRWGKTVNLNMLKRFLEKPLAENGEEINKEDTDNYKLFAGGKIKVQEGFNTIYKQIEQSNLVKNHPEALKVQGTYPVIYIDFKNCKSDSFVSVQELVKKALSDCFRQHKYLAISKQLNDEEKEQINKYTGIISSKKLAIDEIKVGLKFLSEMLYKHHHRKKAWILIDEYDAALNVAYREFDKEGLKQTETLFRSLYESALKGNDFLEKAVVTGIQFIVKASAGSGLNNLDKIDITTPKYAPYYGLLQQEFEQFFKHFNVPDKYFKSAKQWYNGYKVQSYDQKDHMVIDQLIDKYNVWSIISYLKDGNYEKFRSYWEESGSIDFLTELFKTINVKEQIEQLIEESAEGKSGKIVFTRERNFSDKDFMTLRNMIGANKEVTKNGLDILFSYLFIVGYLTIDEDNKENTYQLPNMEIKHEMGKRLLEYYQTICTIDRKKMQGLTNIIQKVLDIEKEKNISHVKTLFKDFYSQFKEIIKGITLVNDKNDEGVFTNEDVVHSILNYIVLQTQHSTFGSEVYTSKLHSDKKGRADIKITNKDIGIIIEVKCVAVPDLDDGHMQGAIKQAISYRNLLKNIDNNIFVAINVDKKVIKPEERDIELLCVSDIFNKKEVFGIDVLGNDNIFGVDSDFLQGVMEA